LEICFAIDMRTGGRIRPADGDRYCACAAHADDVERIALLNDHAARHDEVGPCEIPLGQFVDVAIEEAHVPFGRKERRHRYQAQRRRGGAPADRLASGAEIEE
jgi:hypothetical protein